ncbi:DUF3667 domain-containing protein [Sabulilitoribacter multivorans]|uniref:DUF3667 domain-containing protein n=1 Tax=Flaviramulus multivorans TaxID=1304750 RepID=A0ABS9ILI3_9FLAO|nr:DUF3667 domain-containing protein [Flaviramulus multivorans]MCF7561442.1 DUF3667 domain-containing protein [Flaviramulus multivorans]
MTCKNCDTKLLDTQKYCFECGAKVIKNRLTLKSIFQDINSQFFNYDNKLFQTFKLLFTKPEEVIISFINGTRKKYINVIQYFAISLTLVGFQIFLMNTFFKDAYNIDMPFGNTLENFPNQDKNPFSPQNFSYEEVNNYQSLIYILSVPFSAIATWLTYFIIGNRRFNFTEHIIINLYYSAQIVIVTAIITILFLCFGINFMLITGLITIVNFIYFYYVLKRVFNTSYLETLGSFFIILVFISAVFLTISLLLGLIIGILIA